MQLPRRLRFAVLVALTLEHEDVILPPDSLARSWASSDQLNAVIDALLAAATQVQPIQFHQRPALPDPGDDLVLECALQAQATGTLTTNLRDFVGVEAAFGVKVIKLGELVAQLRKEGQ